MSAIRKSIAFSLITALFIATACGSDGGDASGERRVDDDFYVSASGAARFPYGDLTDWVTWGDQVSVFTVVSEEQLPPRPRVMENREGYVGRTVSLRVDETIWSREGAPSLNNGEVVQMTTWGWGMRDGELRPMVIWGGVRLEVGKRYLAPLLLVNDRNAPGSEWIMLPDSAMPFEGERVIRPNTSRQNLLPAAEEVIGKNSEEIATILNSADPDPLVVEHMRLEPDERMEAYGSERREIIHATQTAEAAQAPGDQ